jgi:hypothetical protein
LCARGRACVCDRAIRAASRTAHHTALTAVGGCCAAQF